MKVSQQLFRPLLVALQEFLADSAVVMAADILVLDEAVSFPREADNCCKLKHSPGLQGFLADSTVVVAADILVLDEAVSFSREADLAAGAAASAGVGALALSSNGGGGGLAGAGDVLRCARALAGGQAALAASARIE